MKRNEVDFYGIINRTLAAASEEQRLNGRGWYDFARRDCQWRAEHYNVTLETFAGVVAALSPGCKWIDNVHYANLIFEHGEDAKVWTYHSRNKYRALDIAYTGDITVLSGEKVVPFYNAIVDPSHDWPVIDIWMMRLFEVAPRQYLRRAEREACVEAFRKVAAESGLNVAAIQATLWIFIKEKTENTESPF